MISKQEITKELGLLQNKQKVKLGFNKKDKMDTASVEWNS